MEYSPKYINLPKSAYRWVLLDSAKFTKEELFAVYKHNDTNSWCVLKKSPILNSINVFLISEKEIKSYVKTDMECLINLLTNSINQYIFIIQETKIGTVSDAYNLN